MHRSGFAFILLSISASCTHREFGDSDSDDGETAARQAQPRAAAVSCNPASTRRENGKFVSFGVFDECLGESKAVRVELYERAFPARTDRPVCVSSKPESRLNVSDFQFASTLDYISAVQSRRVDDSGAFGVEIDKHKRRFRWVRVTLSTPLSCSNGRSVRFGWLSTKDVMEVIDRRDSAPAAAWDGKLGWPAADTPPGFLQNQIVSRFGSTGEERQSLGMIGRYGPDGHPRRHGGIDFALRIGTAQVATARGTVIEQGYNHRGGWYVDIRHDAQTYSHYGHNESIQVKVGDSVSKGQAIATVGFGGNATLPHIHYGLNRSGSYVDPSPYFPSVPRLVFAPPRSAHAKPRKVNFWVGSSPLNRTVAVASLRAWVATGDVAADLKGLLDFTKQESRDALKKAFSTQLSLPFTAAQLDDFLRNSPVGSQLIGDLAGAFNARGSGSDRGAPLRSTLVLLSAGKSPFGIIDVLENYPLEFLDIDILKALPAVKGSAAIVETLKRLNQVHPI